MFPSNGPVIIFSYVLISQCEQGDNEIRSSYTRQVVSDGELHARTNEKCVYLGYLSRTVKFPIVTQQLND